MPNILSCQVKILEADLLTEVKRHLNYWKSQGKLDFIRNHVMPVMRSYRGHLHFTRNKDMEGMPDLTVLLPGGKVLWLELKSSKGKLSKAQELFKKRCELLGHLYAVLSVSDWSTMPDAIKQIVFDSRSVERSTEAFRKV